MRTQSIGMRSYPCLRWEIHQVRFLQKGGAAAACRCPHIVPHPQPPCRNPLATCPAALPFLPMYVKSVRIQNHTLTMYTAIHQPRPSETIHRMQHEIFIRYWIGRLGQVFPTLLFSDPSRSYKFVRRLWLYIYMHYITRETWTHIELLRTSS